MSFQALTGLPAKPGIVLGLQTMAALMKELGDPYLQQPHLLIAGTNGKGSTAAYCSALLQARGLKTALYTSPHVMDVCERFQIQNIKMDERSFDRLGAEVAAAAKKAGVNPTFFEAMTAMAHLWFAEQGVDAAVLEVGLGGRLDATNLGHHSVVVLTEISHDHMDLLGTTLEEIAYEKASTISANGVVVSIAQDPAAMVMIESLADERKAKLYVAGDDDLDHNMARHLLTGFYQKRNFKLAELAVLHFCRVGGFNQKPAKGAVVDALKKLSLPARLHTVHRDPTVIVDGAHNPAAMRHLFQSLPKDVTRTHLLLAIKEDKDWGAVLDEIPQATANLCFTTLEAQTDAGRARFVNPEKLLQYATQQRKSAQGLAISPEPRLFVKSWLMNAQAHESLIVTGSFYLAGDILRSLT